MKSLLVNALTVITLLLVFSAPTFAQEKSDAIINVDGIGFSRIIDDELVAFDLVAAYDEHSIVEANCSAFKSRLQGVDWCFSSAENQMTFESATRDNGNNQYLPFCWRTLCTGHEPGQSCSQGRSPHGHSDWQPACAERPIQCSHCLSGRYGA